jgi:hypothetical protein
VIGSGICRLITDLVLTLVFSCLAVLNRHNFIVFICDFTGLGKVKDTEKKRGREKKKLFESTTREAEKETGKYTVI